jgi:hypothetical protein
MKELIRVPRCDVMDLTDPDEVEHYGKWYRRYAMDEEGQVLYKNTLYDLAIIAEHEKANGNLVCPRCSKEYHMLEFDEDEAELRQEADHGPYECWQTHLEMGFCEATEVDPKGQEAGNDSSDS